MKQSADAHMVKTTLASLQFLIAKPSELFDPYASLAALEHLVTVAKEKNDPESEKYSIVLPQCRPLVGSKALQSVLVKLVASKQEAEIAKVIEKAVKALNQQKGGGEPGRAPPSPYPRGRGRRAFNVKCFSCRKMGHIAKLCPFAQASLGFGMRKEDVA